MEDVKLRLDKNGEGAFYIMNNAEQAGEMAVAIEDKNLTVYHTEVLPELEGKGFAGRLLAAMADYARQNSLKVVPLCSYVHAQFKHHPETYNDIWGK